MLDASRLALIRHAAALAAAGAIALGAAGPHAAEHAYGEPLTTATETVAVCPGQPSAHFDAPRFIEVRPCPACLLARVGLGEPASLPPAPAVPAPLLGLARVAPDRVAGPAAHPRRSRGPPALISS